MKGLLFITHQTERISYLRSVEIALQGGCKQIQLRMKDAPLAEIERIGRISLRLCAFAGAKLFIDDHVDICRRLSAAGVHLGKNDMSPTEARRMLDYSYIIGGTANTFDDIMRLHREHVDYVGLGPFRFTTTKKNLSPVLGLEGFREIIAQCDEDKINLPIIAIGGITRADIPELMQAGVSGIAMSSSILQADDPVDEVRQVIQEIEIHQTT